jgi:hypothetical protein
MLQSVKRLRGYAIHARDGEIGTAQEFYVDDQTWVLRYLVVDTGGWLTGQRVLLSTIAVDQPDRDAEVIPVNLSQEQVENSPPIDAVKPVSRQMEAELHDHYGWVPYWRPALPAAGIGAMAAAQTLSDVFEAEDATPEIEAAQAEGDSHLRSTRELAGYQIRAQDEGIGQFDDLIADDETWLARYIVVDTGSWLAGKKVVLATAWIEGVAWAGRTVHVNLRREAVEKSPAYDPDMTIRRPYEARLHNHYGQPKYWLG